LNKVKIQFSIFRFLLFFFEPRKEEEEEKSKSLSRAKGLPDRPQPCQGDEHEFL